MTEFGLRTPERLRAAVRKAENEKEEALRERFLAANLFHGDHVAVAIDELGEDSGYVQILEQEFLRDKKGANMGERFAMALSEKYLGKVHIIELGLTTNPADDGAIDGLKKEYRNHLKWMKENGLVEDELPRQGGGRAISYRPPVLPEARDQSVVMVRNRKLVHTRITHDNLVVSIGIAKRMVFSMPRLNLHMLDRKFPDAGILDDVEITDEQALSFIEDTFLQHGSGGVQPIRTAYYLATDVLRKVE